MTNIRLTEDDLDPIYTEEKAKHKRIPTWFKIAAALVGALVAWLLAGGVN